MTSRLTILQFAGDFREAALRLDSGGPETYRAQAHSVGYVQRLTLQLEAVTTIVALTGEPYRVRLPSGATAIGAGFSKRTDSREILRLIEATKPDALILRWTPIRVLRWAVRNRIRTLALLATSFDERRLASRLRLSLLSHYLRSPVIDLVANHGRRSAEQLVRAGTPATKVVPWDWPPTSSPFDHPPKERPSGATIFYVGTLSSTKGVLDLIRSIPSVASVHPTVRLQLAGLPTEEVVDAIRELGLSDRVELLGQVPNGDVVPRMCKADVVVVPSRWDYPEGLPITIYEALASRTPLVASDHPMFSGNVVDGESAILFRAGRPADLARGVCRVLGDRQLYSALSLNSAAAWARLQLPVEWSTMIDRWLSNRVEDRAWLLSHSMARYDYSSR